MSERLPSFIVGGAVKGATTWIAHQLREHPQVFMPAPEPHYFSSEFARGIGWYGSLFADAAPDAVIGEKSADYLAHAAAPARISDRLPHVRLVMQLRNPVERAYSDYCMLFRRGTVGADIGHHLSPASEQPRFLQDGRYHHHLSRWLDYFPAEQLKVILHDDIKGNAAETIRGVCAHVGIAPRVDETAMVSRKNDSEALFLPLAMRRALRPVKRFVAPVRGAGWFRRVHGTIARPVPYPPLTPALRDRLTGFYADDIERLAKLLDRDLSHWTARPDPLAAVA